MRAYRSSGITWRESPEENHLPNPAPLHSSKRLHWTDGMSVISTTELLIAISDGLQRCYCLDVSATLLNLDKYIKRKIKACCSQEIKRYQRMDFFPLLVWKVLNKEAMGAVLVQFRSTLIKKTHSVFRSECRMIFLWEVCCTRFCTPRRVYQKHQ